MGGNFCPYYKDKEVFEQFNQIITALGGKPMSEEEFKSRELRNQRSGLDYSAMEAAYRMWELNNGHSYDKAPNGEDSIIFQSLLRKNNNDVNAAIRAKSAIYTKNFADKYGDWLGLNNENEIATILKKAKANGTFMKAPNGKPTNLTERQWLQVRTKAFKEWFGDWENDPENASKVIDENGEPLVVYHGTLGEFTIFDFNKLGEVTGQGYYTDHIIGEKIPFDSSYAFFFTDNKEAAYSYKNLAIYNQNQFRSKVYWNLQSIFEGDKYSFTEFEGKDKEEQKNFIDNVVSPFMGFDVRREANAIIDGKSTLTEKQKKEYAEKFKQTARKIENLTDARSISNKRNNLEREKKELKFILDNKEAIINGTLLSPFQHYALSITTNYGNWDRGDVYLTINYKDGKYEVLGLTHKAGDWKQITSDNFDAVVAEWQRGINGNEANLVKEEKEGKYDSKGNIMEVFLNIKNPLEHDYEGSAFPDMYGKDRKYPTAYIAARQMKKARSEGRDGVIYRNVRDPFLMTSYGILGANQVKSATDNNGEFSTEDDRIRNSNIPLDQNGEPALQSKANKTDYFGEKFDKAFPESLFGKDVNKRLMDGESVPSNEILDILIQKNTISDANADLAQVLHYYNIPVKFEAIDEPGALMAFKIEDGERYIAIDAYKMTLVSKRYASDAFLHEIVHHITEDTLYHPVTEEQKEFKKLNHDLWEFFNNLYPASQYGRLNDFYCLKDEYEFAAEFMTNRSVREMLFNYGKKQYHEGNKSILSKIVRFIKSAFRALFVKDPKIKELKEYQKKFEDYIYNNKVFNPGVPTSELLNEMIDKLDYDTLNQEWLMDEQKKLSRSHLHVIMPEIETGELKQGIEDGDKEAEREVNKLAKSIVETLEKRLAAVLASNLSPQLKSSLSQEMQTQIQQFKSEQVSKYRAIITLLSQVAPQITEDIQNIQRLNKNNMLTSDTFYMYNKHDYFGAYDRILKDIEEALAKDSVVRYLSSTEQEGTEDERMEDIKRFYNITKKCQSKITSAISIMNQILLRNVKRDLAIIANETNSPNMAAFVQQMDNYGVDIGWLSQTFGDASRSNNEELKALVYLVNKANNESDKLLNAKSTQLVKLQQALKNGESLQDLYEKDNGYATGYLVRKYNYGKFYNDYNEFMNKLNLSLGLDPKNRIIPDDEEIRIQWQTKKNEWLDKHCDRKFTKEYYDNFIKLSQVTREAYDLIQNQIKVIKQKCYDEKTGYYDYDDLTKQEWDDLNDLYSQKRRLSSKYRADGSEKAEGDDDYTIYKELSQLRENLYSDNHAHVNREAWQKARNKIIEKCGGLEEMKKGTDNKDFDWKRLRKWDSRNSKVTLKMNSEGNKPLLFEAIDNELPVKAVYDVIDKNGKSDGGAKYDANKKTINEILAPCRNQYTGEVDPKLLTKGSKLKIQELERENAQIARAARKRNPQIRDAERLYAKIFDKYATRESTDTYKRQLRLVQKKAAETNNEHLIDAFRAATGSYKMLDSEIVIYRLHKWYNKIAVKDEYKDQFVDITPGDGWLDKDDSKFINKDFDESEGMSMVPKKSLYDNSKAYAKVMNSKTLKALYDAVYQTIDEANQLQTVRNYYDSYMLPQITGSDFKAAKATKWAEAWKYIKDNKNGSLWKRIIENPYTDTPKTTIVGAAIGAIGGGLLAGVAGATLGATIGAGVGFQKGLLGTKHLMQQNEQDEVFGQALNNIFSKTDEFGNTLEINNPDFLESSGMRADGRQLNMIPIYYTKKLDNPAQITSDLIGSVCQYYDKSVRFNKRSQIKDTCEAIVDHIGQRKYLNTAGSSFEGLKTATQNQMDGKKRVSVVDDGRNSRTYQAAKKFLEMNLYDIRQDKGWGATMSKIGAAFRNLATIVNLGGNPVVAFTGFFTLVWNDMVNSVVGYKYGKGAFLTHPAKYIKSWLMEDETNMSAGKEVMKSIIRSFKGGTYIAKNLTNDVHQLLMEEYNIAGQLDIKGKNSNRNRWLEIISRHAIFGGLTLADYVSKGHVMESVLMSYKYIDGHFVTKTDVIINNMGKSESEIKAAIKQYDKARSLRSIFKAKNFELVVDDKYKDAYAEVENEIKNKIIRYGAAADGVPTATQKAAITTSFIGSCILMHRQYLPMMIQERFQKGQYNLDTQEYELGVFRAVGSLLLAPLIDARKIAGGSIVTAPFNKKFWKTLGKEYKHEFKSLLNPYSERDINGVPAYVYQQAVKQFVVEIAMYNLLLSPLVGFICSKADEDDKKDELLLQFAAFLLRRLQWEAFTPYRADDLRSNFRTVTAAQGLADKSEAFCNSLIRWYSPQGSLFNTFLGFENSKTKQYDPIVKKGAYKGWTKLERDAFKLFVPHHSAYEQINDARAKRIYYENQIMQIEK